MPPAPALLLPLHALALLSALPRAACQPPPPLPSPAKPAPFFSWDTLPRAFHGANRSGMFNDGAIAALANFSIVTLEKWYTPCGAQGPAQSGPSCDVEDKMFDTFRRLKALNPRHTTMMYLNSMFNFAFYRLNGLVLAREAAGERLLLRDERGALVTLCNDGNVYCNVTTFDHTSAAMRALWQEAVANATSAGGVDGIFADHGDVAMGPQGGGTTPQLCNGKGAERRCWNFTDAFAAAFNEGHFWLVNSTQDVVARLPGRGPVVDGPWATWFAPACNFSALRPMVERGVDGTGPFVIEAHTGARSCSPDESCLAHFLAAAEGFTYLSCFADAPAPPQPEFARPLGPPTGPPAEAGGVVRRSFRGPAGLTNVTVDLRTGVGRVQWAGAPPPPPPPPAACGALPPNTAVAQHDVAVHPNVADAAACCGLCAANEACALWCFHGEMASRECHLHGAAGQPHALAGATSGVFNRTRARY